MLLTCLLALTVSPQAASPAQIQSQATEKAAQKAVATMEDPMMEKVSEFIKMAAIDKSKPNWKTRLPQPPKFTFAEDMDYFWNLETNKGDIKIRLFHEQAPMHVSSTVYLTELGFYDDLTFHRVITRFMAQGGCPLGTGTGSPGYKYAGEFSPDLKHDRPGLLSMANAGPNTDGSQFFLTFVPTPHLNGKHTIFGEVVEGLDTTVKALEKSGSQSGRPTEPLMLKKATISMAKKEAMGSVKAKEASGKE